MAFRILRKLEWEPSHTEYVSLLEGVFEDVPGVTLATPQEKKQFWAENASLRQLNYPQLKLALQSRWDYEAKRLGSRYQRFFMDSLQEPIVARACQPSRVDKILERFGFEGFDSTFG